MSYQVTAPLVIVRDKDGVSHHVYQDGFLPDGSDPEHVKQLLAEKLVAVVDAAAPASEEDKPAKVDDILKDVGDDKAKAAAALEAEVARGDKARSTLVDKLRAIAEA
jgi:hypothetical protein